MEWRTDDIRSLDRLITPVEEPLPLPVVPDWDQQLRRATQLTRLIDRHLDYEQRSRPMRPGESLTPLGLCPEQRVNMLTDVWAITVGGNS